ncbi:hypothetical protein MXB_1983, partial [Myxobolus squamalis]
MFYQNKFLITDLPSYHDLLKLVNKKNSGLIKHEYHAKIPIAPKYISNTREGIINFLNSKLLIYDDELEGEILAYDSNFKLIDQHGAIYYQDPRPHYNISTSLILLRLKDGQNLKGSVKMVGQKHCSVLVYECVQASIRFPDDYSNYVFSGLQIDTKIRFRVTDTKLQNCTLTLYGVLRKKSVTTYGRLDPYCRESDAQKIVIQARLFQIIYIGLETYSRDDAYQ